MNLFKRVNVKAHHLLPIAFNLSSVLLLPITFYLFLAPISAQNLIKNPSFEDINCPVRYTGFPNQIDQYVNGWRSGNCASPDIYAPCSADSITRPPAAWYGRQTARTGTNFAAVGFYNIGPTPWYEYLVSELPAPLQAGRQYEISYWVSRADSVRYATDELGAAFSPQIDTCVGGFQGPVLQYTPAITASRMLTDTSGWTNVSGTYTANGTEQYFIVGCFTPWSQVNLHDYGSGQNRCYYYLDDVEVKPITSTATDNDMEGGWKVGPNPFQKNLHVRMNESDGRLVLRNAFGKKVWESNSLAGEELVINTSFLPVGVYLLESQFRGGRKVVRLVKTEN